MNGNFSNLPLGEKISQIRKAKGYSMENMAHAINKSQAFISRFENGNAECSDDELTTIKKFLEIETAPLQEHELKLYRDRIIVCRDLSLSERYTEAEAILDELSIIMELPFEHSLCVMYLMQKAETMLSAGFMKANRENTIAYDDHMETQLIHVDELLAKAEPLLCNANSEALYLYHHVLGRVYHYRDENANALKHYLLAYNTNCAFSNEYFLLSGIGTSYNFAGKLTKALVYLELAKANYRGSSADLRWTHVNHVVAALYLSLGDIPKAIDLLNKNLAQAKSINCEDVVAAVYVRLGYAYQIMGNYEESIRCFDMVLHDKVIPRRRTGMVYKAHSLRLMKKYDECNELLEQARALDSDDEDMEIFIDTVSHLMTLNNDESANYIAEKSIPLICRTYAACDKWHAIRLCNELEAHYKKKRTMTKANAIAVVARDIYKDMYEGDIEF